MTPASKVPNKHTPWPCCVLTLFPEVFPGPLGVSLTQKALEKGVWQLHTLAIRDFAEDKHSTVDDVPFGGGAGMLLLPEIIHRGLEKATSLFPDNKLLYMSPRGRLADQAYIEELAQTPGLTIVCGRYEGIDQRVIDKWDVEEVSMGDYVLCGGEVAAMTLMEACVRWLPGVVGDKASLLSDSLQYHLLEHPHYTRPQEWRGQKVPDVLLSGHHKNIDLWRLNESEALTKARRPDLWQKYCATKATSTRKKTGN